MDGLRRLSPALGCVPWRGACLPLPPRDLPPLLGGAELRNRRGWGIKVKKRKEKFPIITGLWDRRLWEMHQISSQLGSSDSQPRVVAPSQLGEREQQTLRSTGKAAVVERMPSERGQGRFGGAGGEGRAWSSAGDLAPSREESRALPLLGCRLWP